VKDLHSETNGSTKDVDESERSMDCTESASISQDSRSGFDTPFASSSPAMTDSVVKATKPPRPRDRSDKKRDRSKKDKKTGNKSVPGSGESPMSNGTNVDTLEICR